MDGNPFTRTETIDRIMTGAEARAKCERLALDEALTAHVVRQFEARNASPDTHDQYCGCAHGRTSPGECDSIQSGRSDGRMAYGQSWEGSLEDMARVMGVDEDAFYENPDAFPHVRATWDEFFCE